MQKNNFGTADALMKIFNFHRIESDLDCAVYYNGKRIYDISHRLVIQKGLTQEQVDVIKQLHVEKLDIFEPEINLKILLWHNSDLKHLKKF